MKDKILTLFTGVILSALLLTGCAARSGMGDLRAEVSDAQQTAGEAAAQASATDDRLTTIEADLADIRRETRANSNRLNQLNDKLDRVFEGSAYK